MEREGKEQRSQTLTQSCHKAQLADSTMKTTVPRTHPHAQSFQSAFQQHCAPLQTIIGHLTRTVGVNTSAKQKKEQNGGETRQGG